MFPRNPIEEHANCSSRNTVIGSKLVLVSLSLCVFLSYFSDNGFGKLGLRQLRSAPNPLWILSQVVIISARGVMPTLGTHVVAVGFVIAKEQVRRSNTEAIVTAMKHKRCLLWNDANFRQVAQPMGLDLAISETDRAVPASPHSPGPLPAVPNLRQMLWNWTPLVHFSPKAGVFIVRQLDGYIQMANPCLVLGAHLLMMGSGSSEGHSATTGGLCAFRIATFSPRARRTI